MSVKIIFNVSKQNRKNFAQIFFQMLTPEQIANLPSDSKKEYLRTMLLLDEKKKEQSIRDDFLSFVKHMWPDFIEGEHHKIMAEKFNRVANGELKRLIINMAPRHTK